MTMKTDFIRKAPNVCMMDSMMMCCCMSMAMCMVKIRTVSD